MNSNRPTNKMDFRKLRQKLSQKTSKAPHPKGCHIFLGARKKTGRRKKLEYGVINIDKRRYYAHQLSVMLHLQQTKIPDGFVVSHLCHNTLCVNASHLNLEKIAMNNKRKECFNSNECVGHGREPKCIL